MDMDLGSLRDKVYLKILETSDDMRTMSNETLVQACILFDDFSYD